MSGTGIGISSAFQRLSEIAPVPPVPPAEGFYNAYIYLYDLKSSGVDGGAATQGSWETRDINTEVEDTANICTLAADQFTIPAGIYRVFASAPCYRGQSNQIRLYNITDGALEVLGTSTYSRDADSAQSRSFVDGRFTIASPKVFEIQHQVQNTQAGNGHGVSQTWGDNIWTIVELWRETP